MSYLHEWHMQQHIILAPRPLGPWGGAKGQISLNLNYLVNFKYFLNQALCAFSHMKDFFESVGICDGAPSNVF